MNLLKLYLIIQKVNTRYDSFDSAIVCAENEEEARVTHPDHTKNNDWPEWQHLEANYWDWAKPENVKVRLIGVANKNTEKGVVLASFNAG